MRLGKLSAARGLLSVRVCGSTIFLPGKVEVCGKERSNCMCKHNNTVVEEKGKKKKVLRRLVCTDCGLAVTGWKSPSRLRYKDGSTGKGCSSGSS